MKLFELLTKNLKIHVENTLNIFLDNWLNIWSLTLYKNFVIQNSQTKFNFFLFKSHVKKFYDIKYSDKTSILCIIINNKSLKNNKN